MSDDSFEIICPKCRASVPADAEVCPACGHELIIRPERAARATAAARSAEAQAPEAADAARQAVERIRELSAHVPPSRAVALAPSAYAGFWVRVLASLIDSLLTKPFEPDELIARMRGLLARTSLPQRPRTLDPRAHGLTPREQEVLTLLAEGRNPKEVASELSISPKTVATHIQHLFDKVGVHSRGELIARSYILGIVSSLAAGAAVI